MRRSIALLVVLLMVFGPFAQGVDLGPKVSIEPVEVNDVEPPASIVQPDARELLSNIDGFFTENLGQKGEGAGKFYCEGSPLSVAFDADWVAYDYRPEGRDRGVMFRVEFEGANPVKPVGTGPMEYKSNFFLGNDSNNWISGADSFREVLYSGLYEDIDLRFYFQEDRLKYDFLVGPWAIPSVIHLVYNGVEGLAIDDISGDLLIRTAVGTVRDEAPRAFQEGPEGFWEVPSNFRLVDSRTVVIELGDYERALPLVIDPGLLFSTYLGGTADDAWAGTSMLVDDDGNVYVSGHTRSSNFPVTFGSYDTTYDSPDGFVTKLRNDGKTLMFSTFIGSTGYDFGGPLVLDSSGNIYVGGGTDSDAFPTTPGAFERTYHGGGFDAFVMKLNHNGSTLLRSTYFGGNGREGFRSIHMDSEGSLLLYSGTESSDLPTVAGCYDTTHNGGWDGVIVKMDANLSQLLALTYLGGSGNDDVGYMVVDDDGCPYVMGYTKSNDFPTSSNAYQDTLDGVYDTFITKLDNDLTKLEYSTYLGGDEGEIPSGIDLDDNGRVFITGVTSSTDFPLKNAYDNEIEGSGDAFVTVLSASGDRLEYSTYLGGSGGDGGRCITPEGDDIILVGISTSSSDLPAVESHHNGSSDWYVCRLNISSNALLAGDYIGGSDSDGPMGVVSGESNITFIGSSISTDFPTTPGAYDRTHGGQYDIIVLRLTLKDLNGTLPSAPLKVSAEAGDASVSIEWDPPEDTGGLAIRGYRVLVGDSETNLEIIALTDPDKHEFTHQNLLNGRTYYYGVRAFNWIGVGNLSAIVNATPLGVPSAVMNLKAIPGCSTVQLRWEPPESDGGTPLLGYHVHRGLSVDGIRALESLDNVTEYTDEGLVNGQAYFYKVFAFNGLGNATLCTPVGANPAGLPSEPLGLTVIPSENQLTLEWDPPREKGAEDLFGYIIHRGLSETSLNKVATVEHFVRTYIDNDLSNGVLYYYSVQATNRIGEGPMCPPVAAMPVGRPGAPWDLSWLGGDGTVTITWSPPEFDGGAPITGYHVFRGTTRDQLEYLDITDGDAPSFTDTGIMNGQTFYYAVCAVNNVGDGPKTQAIPATPLALPDAPGSLVAEPGNGQVTITWTRPQRDGGAEITQYNIYRGTSAGSLQHVHTMAKSRFTYEDEDVLVGIITYHYAVAAVTAAGEGPQSIVASATPYGPPGIPTDLVATPGDGEVRLTWSAPEEDGANTIIGYVVMRGDTPVSIRELAQLADVTSYLDTSVTNGITYQYAVAAINEAGPGDNTDTVSATPLRLDTEPGRVLGLVGETNSAKVTLQWSAPTDDGGSPVTGYVVMRGESRGDLQVVATLGVVTSWTDEDAQRGRTYYYVVCAVNDVGQGEPCATFEVEVPKKAEESPGFETLIVISCLLILVPIFKKRRG